MISIDIKVNGQTVISCHAVRISPVNGTPREGEMCIYNFFIYGAPSGTIEHPYGVAAGLSCKMMNAFEERVKL